MGSKNPLYSDEELTRLTEFFAAFGIPTDHMIADPGIRLDGDGLLLAPEFMWSTKNLSDEQLVATEKLFQVKLERP